MNSILQFIILFVSIFEFFIIIGFGLYIGLLAEIDDTTYIKSTVDFIIKLFEERNWFGKLLSCLVVIILIPSIFMIIVVQIFYYIIQFFILIWKIGNKK